MEHFSIGSRVKTSKGIGKLVGVIGEEAKVMLDRGGIATVFARELKEPQPAQAFEGMEVMSEPLPGSGTEILVKPSFEEPVQSSDDLEILKPLAKAKNPFDSLALASELPEEPDEKPPELLEPQPTALTPEEALKEPAGEGKDYLDVPQRITKKWLGSQDPKDLISLLDPGAPKLTAARRKRLVDHLDETDGWEDAN